MVSEKATPTEAHRGAWKSVARSSRVQHRPVPACPAPGGAFGEGRGHPFTLLRTLPGSPPFF